jgi:uncharacterized protein (DUF4415 family)
MNPHDDDAPEFTTEILKRARPAKDVLPAEVMAAFRNRGGRPKAEIAKVPVSIRLDPEVLAAFKETGAGWQTRMNEVLKSAMDALPRQPKQA